MFSISPKKFYDIDEIQKLIKGVIPHLSHASDGLIFQRENYTYKSRRSYASLKWKFPNLNSVDFLFRNDKKGKNIFVQNTNGSIVHVQTQKYYIQRAYTSYIDGRILECARDKCLNILVLTKLRFDKSLPNAIFVYHEVINNCT